MTIEHALQEEKAIVQLRYQPVWVYVLLSFSSFGIYNVYWFYKHWRFLKQHDGINVTPFLRGWFSILFAHALFDRMNTIAVEKGHAGIPYNGYATGFVILTIISNMSSRLLPAPFDFFAGLCGPAFLFVVPTLKQINYIVRQTFPGRSDSSVATVDVVMLVVGGVVVFLALMGTLMPE